MVNVCTIKVEYQIKLLQEIWDELQYFKVPYQSQDCRMSLWKTLLNDLPYKRQPLQYYVH